LGSSESLVLNGNVELFQITNNIVHDNNNIGIDAIGFEGVCPSPDLDQARNGIISGNTVYNISSANNPAYEGDLSADGIYVDGGKDIIIERNTVYQTDIGVELASEHRGRMTSNVILRNNFIYQNNVVGLSIGGYDRQRGGTERCQILNNTLFFNDKLQNGTGEINIQFNTVNNVFKNNLVYANAQSLLMSNEYSENIGNDFDYNIYFCANAAESSWQWRQIDYTGFSSYRAGSGNDAHSTFIDPQFTNLTAPDLHLGAASPAINAGILLTSAGSVDIDNQPRVLGNKIDLGGDEVSAIK
jgi:parallel beta-helix repeat protein